MGLGLGLGLGLVVPHHELLHGEAGTPSQLTYDEATLCVGLCKAIGEAQPRERQNKTCLGACLLAWGWRPVWHTA